MGINLTPKRRERLVRFLSQHVEEMRNRREVRCARIRDSVRRWEAKSKPSNYPWVGASSMHIPVVAAHGESILARILNSLKAQDRHLVVVAYNEDVQIGGLNDPITSKPLTWRWVAEALEDYLTWEMSPAGDVDWEEIETRIVLDTLQTGTGVLDTRWETLVERDYALDDPQTPLTRPMRDNVTFSVRPFEDFLTPPQYDSLDRVPIASILYRRRPSELRAKGVVLDWDSDVVEEIIEKSVGEIRISPVAAFLAATEEQGEGETYTTGDIEMLESWIRFDLDDSGYETRLLVDHALEDPGLILRVIPWPGPFPIDISRYIRRRYRLPGMSLAERLESLDEGISANLNQAINNGTISTARFWKVLKGSLAAKTWGRTRPGGKVVVESMDEIAPEQAGELYPSIFEIGNVLNAWAEKVSKINDYSLGRESQALGRQSTATSTLALLQETGTYHDSISREIRLCLNRAGQKWLDLLVQHKPLSRIAQVLGTERAAVLLQALELPEGDLRKRIGVRVAFSSTAATRELTRQEEAAKSQLLAEYYKSMTQLALLRVQSSVQARSGIPEAAFLVGLADAIAANAELHMSKLLDVYGDSFTTSSLPSWQKVLNDTGQAAGIASGIGGGAIPAGVGGGGGEGALLAPPAAGIGGAPGAMPFGPAQGGGGPFGAPPNGGAGGAIR